MRVLFVAEGGYRAGLGHLLRCRVLAGELIRRGHDAGLVLYGDRSALAQRAWPGTDAVTEIAEAAPVAVVAQAVQQRLASSRYDWLVVDGYGFSKGEIDAMRGSTGCRVLVLDDVPGRELAAEILLNQNCASAAGYSQVPGRIGSFLLGPQYALVDACYLDARRAAVHREAIQRILVSFGGVDRCGRTARVIELLGQVADSMNVDVVAGPYFTHRARLESVGHKVSIRIHDNLPDLSGLMEGCDLMISAAGSTAWQACCVGIPLLAFQTVDNQQGIVDSLVGAQAAFCANASVAPEQEAGIDAGTFGTMFDAVQSQNVRAGLAERAARLVDGGGSGRVVEAMLSFEVQVRS